MSQDKTSFFSNIVFRYRHILFLGMMVLIWCVNMTIDIMELDAAQYAAIASEMARYGEYLEVYHRGADYLDKPPLLFWLTSQVILFLGNTSVAAKLASILFLLVSLWATYGMGRLWYDHRTGLIAACIWASTQAFHLMTLDVRTDGLLTSFVIISVWLFSLFIKYGKLWHLVLGGVAVGGAMLAKGPIGLIIPAVAIMGHLLIIRDWKKLFNPKWLILLLPIAVVMAPMCYGLYTQFDLHPEKVVNGETGVSGLRFFFWTQSFGRITGESIWQNNSPPYYFIQTMLWDFQPWVVFFIPAFCWKIKTWLRQIRKTDTFPEWITFSGFVIPFVALSASRYKLPHYIFPLFPFAAILLSSFLVHHASRIPVWWKGLQWVVLHFLVAAALATVVWAFPAKNPGLYGLIIMGYILMWWCWKRIKDQADRLVLPTMTGVILFQLVISLHLYPHLLRYQSSSLAGKIIKRENPENVYWHDVYGYALDYYSGRVIPQAYGPVVDSLPAGSWVYVSEQGLSGMPPHTVRQSFDDFRVTNLSLPFINPATRHEKVKKMYLIELTGVSPKNQ